MQSTTWWKDLRVTADGTGVVSHVGAALLRIIADRTGLTGGLSGALARRDWWPVHDRGRVLVDLAVMIADGGEAICDIDVLRHQDEVFGSVASPATCWRALDEIGPTQLRRINVARAKVRVQVVVDPKRYRGTCYRAANWIELGRTSGLGRQDRRRSGGEVAPKTVLIYPLADDAAQQLREC